MSTFVRRRPQVRLGAAIGEVLRSGYGRRDLRADLLAGITVGLVAVPLAMALAVASGVPPQHGLYTSIVAGALIALTGGSRLSVAGPTAAFVVILHPISVQFGLGGLTLASLMAGLILIGMGLARMGRLIQFIPYPVTIGFTAGIGVVIATLQIKDLLGLRLTHESGHFFDQLREILRALPGLSPPDLLIGVATLAVLVLWPRLNKTIPRHLAGLAAGALLAWLLGQVLDGFEVATIGSRFSYEAAGLRGQGIPPLPPLPLLPWALPGPGGVPLTVDLELLRHLLGPAVAIALLGAIESLLCAVVADGMAGTRHDPDAELLGQGLGNVVAPFFGGFAATGAIARTATNIRAGARSPVAALVHAGFVLLAVVTLAPVLAFLPMASLAALLLVVAWNMSEARHFVNVLRIAPRQDVAVLLSCFALTVVFDMVVAVGVGVVLAALLFMGRMAELSGAKQITGEQVHVEGGLPEGVRLYEIAGPLFFGAAEKAMDTLQRLDADARVVVLNMSAVPVMDVTGLVALDSAIRDLHRRGICVVLAGVQPQPARTLSRAGLREISGKLAITGSVPEALVLARAYLVGRGV